LELLFGTVCQKSGICQHIKKKCDTTKKNRASEKGGTLHTKGFISVHDHTIRLAQHI